MEKITPQKHSLETFYYSASRMLERGAYYGFRALVVLYMMGETLKMETEEALTVYGILTASLVFSQIIGALIGDLLIGNKKSIIIGGTLQAFGAFTLCISSTFGLYTGLFLIVLGNGLYNPNLTANFGKSYLNKTKLLDVGFTTLYLAVNLGATFGVLLIGYLGEGFDYRIGFASAGVMMLLSIIPIVFTKQKVFPEFKKTSISRRIINIAIAFILVNLFWALYEISNIRFFDLQRTFSEISDIGIQRYVVCIKFIF